MEWISVKDRLPEMEGEYLIYTIDNDCIEVIYYDLNMWSYSFSFERNPTHWMPLPKPPKQ